MDQRFISQRFPRSSGYHPEWIMASVSGGANSLWLSEWLTEALELQPGMRVLDLGCGRGASSIFPWRRHWERSGIVDVDLADTMLDGWQRWLDWHRAIAPHNQDEIQALEADRGSYLGYVRMVGRRRPGARLPDPIAALPVEYKRAPLLRGAT